jgi:hypothetical protein
MNTCKGKIKGAIQTPVTKDVDLAREILDEEQDIALDCRSDELDASSVCNNISNKQTFLYNDAVYLRPLVVLHLSYLCASVLELIVVEYWIEV